MACDINGGLQMVVCDKRLDDGRPCDKCYHLECVGLDQAPKDHVSQNCCRIGCVTRHFENK